MRTELQKQRTDLKEGCTMGMDPGPKHWGAHNASVSGSAGARSPNIRGRAEKTQDRRLSQGGSRGGSGLRAALLPGRGRPPLGPR